MGRRNLKLSRQSNVLQIPPEEWAERAERYAEQAQAVKRMYASGGVLRINTGFPRRTISKAENQRVQRQSRALKRPLPTIPFERERFDRGLATMLGEDETDG